MKKQIKKDVKQPLLVTEPQTVRQQLFQNLFPLSKQSATKIKQQPRQISLNQARFVQVSQSLDLGPKPSPSARIQQPPLLQNFELPQTSHRRYRQQYNSLQIDQPVSHRIQTLSPPSAKPQQINEGLFFNSKNNFHTIDTQNHQNLRPNTVSQNAAKFTQRPKQNQIFEVKKVEQVIQSIDRPMTQGQNTQKANLRDLRRRQRHPYEQNLTESFQSQRQKNQVTQSLTQVELGKIMKRANQLTRVKEVSKSSNFREIVSNKTNCITKFAFATSCGFQPGNPFKQNQDSYTLCPNFCNQAGVHLFAVADGHGLNGHHASAKIKEQFPLLMTDRLRNDPDFISSADEFNSRVPGYFRDTFAIIHDNLINSKQFDSQFSGSTVCSLLFDSKRLFCANVGDSRAVLYTQGKRGGIKCTPLSEDHKPSLPKEKKRVEQMNGRVQPILGPQGQWLGPDRVWMKNEETPGLAMSRSLGDGMAHTIGVISEPEVKQLVLEPDDKFIILASDGVWEFLSNEDIAKIVWPFYQNNSPEQAGNAVVRAAAKKWKENDTVIDDITCITIFLEIE